MHNFLAVALTGPGLITLGVFLGSIVLFISG